MAINARCVCGNLISAKAELAGRRVKCPACEQPITLPLAQPPAPNDGDVTKPTTPKPITAECGGCRKSLRAKPELAGKTVKCPGCGQPVLIGSAPREASASNDDAGDRFVQQLSGTDGLNSLHDEGIDNDLSGLVGLLDELGVAESKTGQRCPGCSSDIDPEAIICIECGYNLETGKSLKRGSFVKDKKGAVDVGPPTKSKGGKKILGLFGGKK